MAITKLLSGLPSRSMEQEAFDAGIEQLMVDLPIWGAEVNALAAGLNSIAAGGAFALPYTFSTTTTDSDPGAGLMRFNSATQNATTVVRLDNLSALGQDVSATIDNFDDSTSVVKGYLRIVKLNDPTRWALFALTAAASPAGYKNLTVALAQFSTANPFTNGDSVIVYFSRTGDKGDTGLPYTLLHLRDERASGTAAPAATIGTTTRTINTSKVNGISGASLASNQITLPAGTYDFQIVANHAYISGGVFLYNVTDVATAIVGLGHLAAAGIPLQTSVLQGRVVIAATKVFEVRHVVTATVTGAAFGAAISSGQPEVFLDVFITKGS